MSVFTEYNQNVRDYHKDPSDSNFNKVWESFHEVFPIIYARLARESVNDQSAQKDAVLEAAEKKILQIVKDKKYTDAAPSSILSTVIGQLSINYYRKHNKEQTTDFSRMFGEDDYSADSFAGFHSGNTLDNIQKDKRYSGKDKHQKIERAAFPKEQQDQIEELLTQANVGNDEIACFSMFHFEEKKISEIATELDIPEGTVKGRIFKARKNLRDYLQDNFHDNGKELFEQILSSEFESEYILKADNSSYTLTSSTERLGDVDTEKEKPLETSIDLEGAIKNFLETGGKNFLVLLKEFHDSRGTSITATAEFLNVDKSSLAKILKQAENENRAEKSTRTVSEVAFITPIIQSEHTKLSSLGQSNLFTLARGDLSLGSLEQIHSDAKELLSEKGLSMAMRKSIGQRTFLKALSYSGFTEDHFISLVEKDISRNMSYQYVKGMKFFGGTEAENPDRSFIIAAALCPYDKNLSNNLAANFLGISENLSAKEIKNRFMQGDMEYGQLFLYSRLTKLKDRKTTAEELGYRSTDNISMIEKGNKGIGEDKFGIYAQNYLDCNCPKETGKLYNKIAENRENLKGKINPPPKEDVFIGM